MGLGAERIPAGITEAKEGWLSTDAWHPLSSRRSASAASDTPTGTSRWSKNDDYPTGSRSAPRRHHPPCYLKGTGSLARREAVAWRSIRGGGTRGRAARVGRERRRAFLCIGHRNIEDGTLEHRHKTVATCRCCQAASDCTPALPSRSSRSTARLQHRWYRPPGSEAGCRRCCRD